MKVTFRDIELFVSVYEERSFTAAAKRDGATQSGVSQHISKLEDRLGIRLFSRNKGQISPSPAGDLYYRKCIEILRSCEVAQQSIGKYKTSLVGEISVGLMPTMARCVLAPALTAFMAANPNVKVRVVEGYSGVLTKQVLASELDFAIVPGFSGATGLRSRLFAQTPELLVERAQFSNRKSGTVRMAEAPPLKLVVPSEGNTRRKLIDAYLSTNNVPIDALLEFDSMFGTLSFVEQSDWAAILPAIMMADQRDLEVFDLRIIKDPDFLLDLILIEQSRQPASAISAALIATLERYTQNINDKWITT